MATWGITKQEDGVAILGTGLTDVKRVTYIIDDTGETGTFSVPMARYSPELVMAMAQDLIAKHVAISNLRGEV